MIEEHWFSIPIWYKDNFFSDEEVCQLRNFCYDTKSKDNKGRVRSNAGGWQSNFITKDLFNSSGCNFFLTNVEKQARLVFEKLSLKHTYNIEYKISSWININKKSNYNAAHNHPLCELSSVYYLTGGSKIVFERPNGDMSFYLENVIESRADTTLTTQYVNFQPRPNLIIFFPSFLVHSVLPSEEDYDRISIASNIEVVYN